ncbi:MAG: glycoside hydrolase family 2, partial [Rikenellaceae bacterium]
MRKRILFLSMFLAISYTASSQEEFKMLWTGMLEPQSEMPQGNAPIQKVERVAPKEIKTTLTTSGSSEWVLNDGWRMMDNATIIDGGKAPLDPNLDVSQWYNATVPGTVLTTLVNQGVYPDPYFGLNNMAIPESLARSQWWYRIEFDAPESDLKNSFLLFNGINYGAIVYLNGTRVGEMKGAFKRGEFDVTDVIKPKGNILTVNIIPTANPGIPHEQTMALGQGLNGGMLSNDGPTFISSIGWDWIPGIRDRNIGLWQDVRLRQTGGVVIGDPLVVTNLPLPDTSYVDITIKTPIKNISSASISGVVRANIEGKIFTQVYTLKGGEESEIVLTNRLSNPRLWWPNGYGSAELYNVELSVTEGDKVADVKDVRFGVRELSYELMVNRGEKENVRYAFTPVDRNDTKKPLFDYINRVKYSKLNNLPTLQSDDLSGLEELDMDDPVGPYLVIRVNGERIFCRGGNWGMNDAMKRVERSTQEPYFRLQKQANFNMIRNWTGESTDHTFYELCDE